jgi:carbamate kinase
VAEPHAHPIVLVAMGGHAFMQPGEAGTIEDHERNAARIAALLMSLVERDYHLCITHGNGPQVGNLLLQQEAAGTGVPGLPLDVLVAMTEGSLGYILQQALLNELRKRQMKRYVVTVVTQVVVDEADPAFHAPSKPIGPFLAREEAERRRDSLGWKVKEDAGRGWRRLVPSPSPQRVVQRHMIRDAVRQGHIVIACGGGGIPVKRQADGQFGGLEAVIDKDLTSSVLATDVGAALLVILTAVPQVCVSFGTPAERPLGAVTLEEIERLQGEGHFPPGSMGPKIEAVVRFLRSGGRRALITNPESLPQAIDGRAGTHFVGGL